LPKARGIAIRLLVPENVGTCLYLKSVGLFRLLQAAGVEVDDRGIAERTGRQLIVPLTRFTTESNVEDLANRALEYLANAGMGAANLYPVVSEIFAELALNAVQHSESDVGAFGLIQFYDTQQGRRFICSVADGGIGIRESLAKNPELAAHVPYDWVAIEKALQEGVTGTGSRTRGIGLYGVAEDMRKAGRQLIIHSGIGMLQTTEEMERSAQRTSLFPGTLASASIPT
jgi:anti-sigma regulatory factor (Ser/Thr protein kinase)